MDYIAEAKNIKISPRKVRLVADSIKSLRPEQAMVTLKVMNKRAAMPVSKTIASAVANAVNNSKATKESLVFKEIMINEGASYKRFHYAARGRMRPYKKRTSHIRVVLTSTGEVRPVKASDQLALPVPKTEVVEKAEEKTSITKKLAAAVTKRVRGTKKDEEKEGGSV